MSKQKVLVLVLVLRESLIYITCLSFVGGPGSGRKQQCKRLTDRYIGWVHVSVGDLLRHEFSSSQDNKWSSIASVVNNGDLAPSVSKIFVTYNPACNIENAWKCMELNSTQVIC